MLTTQFALTTLSANPEYFEEVIKLIEEEFHYTEGNHFEKDFAPLVDPLNFENCYLIINQENNSVAAHLAVCPRTLIKNQCEMKIALVGGIATHKNHRGVGLFKELMNHAIKIHETNVGLFILWSDLENLYEKFSFHRTGVLIETGTRNFSASERPSGYEKTKFSQLNDKEFNAVINLYTSFNEKYFLTLKRENKDWSIIREMSSIDLYLKKNTLGDIEKYFCVNKGRDLTNIVHEVSCKNSQEFSVLLKELENFKLWLPETELSKFSSSNIFYTAFFRLGNEKTLDTFLQTVTNNKLKILSMSEERVTFSFEENLFGASPKDFLQYVFGPKPLEEFGPFGLSLYVPGTDSI